MHIGYLIGAIVSFLLSLGCIISTMIEITQGKYGLMTTNFWGAVIFHGLTAILGLWLLLKAFGKA